MKQELLLEGQGRYRDMNWNQTEYWIHVPTAAYSMLTQWSHILTFNEWCKPSLSNSEFSFFAVSTELLLSVSCWLLVSCCSPFLIHSSLPSCTTSMRNITKFRLPSAPREECHLHLIFLTSLYHELTYWNVSGIAHQRRNGAEGGEVGRAARSLGTACRMQ